MALQIGDTAPDFEAETTEGPIQFHDWIGDSWAVLFSHPKDFTPVCTTELGYMAKIKPEFDRRNVKIIGLSVDPVDKHAKWAARHRGDAGQAPNYPMIGDADFNVSKLYGMLPADISGDPTERTPADNQTVRNVFVIGPDKKIKLILVYPMTTGPQLRRGPARDRLAAADRQAQGRDAGELAAGRGRDHRRLGLRRRGEGDLSGRLGGAAPLHPDRAAAALARAEPPADHNSTRTCPLLARRGYALKIAGRRLARARVASERTKPANAAALALVTSSRPEASEKLIAMSLPTPSARRMPAVAPTFADCAPRRDGYRRPQQH